MDNRGVVVRRKITLGFPEVDNWCEWRSATGSYTGVDYTVSSLEDSHYITVDVGNCQMFEKVFPTLRGAMSAIDQLEHEIQIVIEGFVKNHSFSSSIDSEVSE